MAEAGYGFGGNGGEPGPKVALASCRSLRVPLKLTVSETRKPAVIVEYECCPRSIPVFCS